MTIWVDAEVHVFPPEWCTTAAGFMPDPEEEVLRRVVFEHPERDVSLPRAHEEPLWTEMQRSGIDMALIMGLPWRSADMCRANDEYVASLCAQHPHRYLGLGVLPAPGQYNFREEVARLADLGLRGAKVIPSWQRYQLDDPALTPAIEALIERDMVLMPHTDHAYLNPTAGADPPHALLTVAQRHPELRILAPHLGGLLCLYHLHPPLRESLRNILFITTVPTTMRMIRYALDAVGPERLAFGTDFPFNPSHDQRTVHEEFEREVSDERARTLIGGENVLRFLNVDGADLVDGMAPPQAAVGG